MLKICKTHQLSDLKTIWTKASKEKLLKIKNQQRLRIKMRRLFQKMFSQTDDRSDNGYWYKTKYPDHLFFILLLFVEEVLLETLDTVETQCWRRYILYLFLGKKQLKNIQKALWNKPILDWTGVWIASEAATSFSNCQWKPVFWNQPVLNLTGTWVKNTAVAYVPSINLFWT